MSASARNRFSWSRRRHLGGIAISVCILAAIIGACWWNRAGTKMLDLGSIAE